MLSALRSRYYILLLAAAAVAQAPAVQAPAPTPSSALAATSEPLPVVKVVDADTLHVERAGATEKLRLLSVDTEEKFAAGGASSSSKPQTVFGEECALWARELFADLATEEGPARVRLVFPGGREERDVYGRLLCHVLLPDGRDFNLLLVRSGRSPYFNKYGNSLLAHEEFVAAQAAARAEALGIWDPATNRPDEPGTPAAIRPYAELLPWWDARASAIDGFRRRNAEEPLACVSAEDPPALQAALDAELETVEVFGEPSAKFDETDGSLTVLFRTADRERALRVRIAAADRAAHASVDLAGLLSEYRQNFVYVRGELTWSGRGFELRSSDAAQWRLAGPEPARAAQEVAR